ncbi:MAG TPA: sigma 54-interacting transcriptional regulator [Vicinamibacteria bacterium]|nr:sigma 54-interacting transcriptional regulator [Vicinamibacteria bacterium]
MSPPDSERPLNLNSRAAAGATLADFQSEDAPMAACLKRARLAAATDLPVLILGESGTGKTLLAHALHNSSARAARPFVAFNAAALSDGLLDSQLFGHERGAYTGAQRRVRGKFELADGGSLFIDEIADMSPSAQSKILRAVEYGEFERLGSEELQVADVRLISATHYPLQKFTTSDRFRQDLFFRISGIVLTIPPLRERPRDLPFLVVAEIAHASRKQGKRIVGLDQAAADRLFGYSWPGNLRELSKVLQAAVALAEGDVIDADTLLLEATAPVVAASVPAPAPPVEALTLAEAERRHVLSVLERLGGNKTRAARALGVSRSTLDRKLASS